MSLFESAFPKPILIEEAEYRKHDDEWFNNNPLCEAIEVKKGEVIEQAITYIPDLPNLDNLAEVYQKTALKRLSCVYIAHKWCKRLYSDIISAILFSYVNRDPRRIELKRFQRDLSDLAKTKQREKIYENIITAPLSPLTTTNNAVVAGPSGSGKTSTIRRTLLIIPQVIIHPEFDNSPEKLTQIVWLSFDMPASDSPKALALAFFRAIDNAVNTNYYNEWKGRKSESIEHHYAAMQLLILEYNIGYIHIDEMQFMLKFGSGRNSITLQAIEALFNKLSVPTLISCTPEGLTLFDSLKSQSPTELDIITTSRRAYSDHIYMFGLASIESCFFKQLFDAFFPAQLSKNPDGFSEAFKTKVVTLSAGLLAVIARLAQLYHRSALIVNDMVEEDLLELVFTEQFGPLAEALKQLRETGDEGLLENLINRDNQNNVVWSTEESGSRTIQKRVNVPDISNIHKKKK